MSVHSVAAVAQNRVRVGLDIVAGRPVTPLVFVDLGATTDPADVSAALEWLSAARTTVVVGVAVDGVAPGLARLAEAVDCTLVTTERSIVEVAVRDAASAIASIEATAAIAPRATSTLRGLLRVTSAVDVDAGLIVESLAYSTLLAGPEFVQWRANRAVKPVAASDEPAVLVSRDGALLCVELNRADRHNAFGREIRDGLVDALDLALADDTVTRVVLRGRGASFCSGGDLDEFGSAPDPPLAHVIRLDRSAGVRIDACRARIEVEVHGACIGAGVELPAFAGHVLARPDAFFQLPELSMGLVPGAGGTVSLTRRIGRWRTAFLALSGVRVDAPTALRWGIVDAVVDG